MSMAGILCVLCVGGAYRARMGRASARPGGIADGGDALLMREFDDRRLDEAALQFFPPIGGHAPALGEKAQQFCVENAAPIGQLVQHEIGRAVGLYEDRKSTRLNSSH